MPRILNKSEREIHTTGQERTHQHGAPFLFAYSPKGKKKTQTPQWHKNKQGRQEDKQRTRGQARKAGKEIKAGAKKTKRKANTRAKGQERGQKRGKRDKIEAKHASSHITA